MAFTQQELKDAYKQMKKERKIEADLADLACDKLKAILGFKISYGKDNGWIGVGRADFGVTPLPDVYDLYFQYSQYDPISPAATALLNLQNSVIVGRGNCLNGQFDLSNDPYFANAHQKVYRVIGDYYDAHCCGY